MFLQKKKKKSYFFGNKKITKKNLIELKEKITKNVEALPAIFLGYFNLR